MYKKLFLTMFIISTVGTLSVAQLPPIYDLRDLDLVTSVKSQKSGTCWCHGTYSGIEGTLLKTGGWAAAGESGEPNFAEYHLSWWNGFSVCWNDDLAPEPDTGNGTPLHNGGDYKIFLAYMSRLDGPIREIDAPGDTVPGNDASNIPGQDVIPLTKSSYRKWYIPDANWYYIDGDGAQGSLQNIDTIKNVVMRNGVMPTNYFSNAQMITKWDGNGARWVTHHQPFDAPFESNHSVAIVGWNDSVSGFRYDPPGPGAWLCKNSWGDIQQYFYISYYDLHACRNPEMSVVSFHDIQPMPYTGVYYHDYHGWRDTLTESKEGFNKFVANNSENEYLVDVSFFTTVDHDKYTVKVYDTFESGELKNELASASGSIIHQGYHTRKLNTPVTLENGNDFYIYVGFEKGFQAYDRTSSPPVLTRTRAYDSVVVWSKAEADQSYYRTSPTSPWTDITTKEESINVDGMVVNCKGSQNLCIKGYVLDTMPVVGIENSPALPKTRFQLFNYPNPFKSRTTIQFSVAQHTNTSIDIFNARGGKVYTFAHSKNTAGVEKIVWNGKDTFNNPLPSGIYYAVLKVKTNKSVMTEKRKLFLMK